MAASILTRARSALRTRIDAWAIKRLRVGPVIVQQYAGQDVAPDEDLSDYAKVYQNHPWVYAAIFRIATAAANIPWPLYRRLPDGERELVTNHWLADLFRSPNPRRSRSEILEGTFGFLELTGSAYWAIERERSTYPNEIWPLRPDRMTILPDAEEEVAGYLYKLEGKSVRYEADEVVHFRYWNPTHDLHGQGSLTAARVPLLTDMAAADWNRRYFKQSARPGGLLTSDDELTPEQIDRLRIAWNAQHRGADRFHGVNVMWGMKYQDIGANPKEADFVDGRKMSREEILATHNVPPSLVGLFEYANYANTREQKRIFWEGMVPRLAKVRDTINLQLIQRFEPDFEIDFDLSGVEALQEDAATKATRQTQLVQWGIKSPNEIRAENGDEPREGGDQFVMPMNAMPVGASAPAGGNGEGRAYQKDSTDEGLPRSRVDHVVPDSLDEVGEMSRILDPTRAAAAKLGADTTVDLVRGASADSLAEYDLMADPIALEDLAVNGARKAKYITDAMEQRIKGELYNGIEAGENLTALANRVESATRALKRERYWALRIARTEVRQSLNFGAFHAMAAVGVEKKVWISARDDVTRELHVEADRLSHEEPVPLGESFPAIEADAPGLTGRPEDDINCRCDLGPWVRGLSGKELRQWTGLYRKANDRREGALAQSMVRPLHRYLDDYTARIKRRLRAR